MKDKMYCFDCDEMVVPNLKFVKNHYEICQVGFDVLGKVYLCPVCGMEVAGHYIDDTLKHIYDAYKKAING